MTCPRSSASLLSLLPPAAVLAVLWVGPGLRVGEGRGGEVRAAPPEPRHDQAFGTIEQEDVEAWLEFLCHPYLEGRDSPSAGERFVAEHLAARFTEYGLLEPSPGAGLFHSFARPVLVPSVAECRLSARDAEGEVSAELGFDFTPLRDAVGEASGPLVFCGYGIDVRGFDELGGLPLEGAVALFAEGEPRHARALDGPEATPAANVYRKLTRLGELGAVGALVVRRGPPPEETAPAGWPERPPLSFRSEWASWVGERPDAVLSSPIPALEISLDLARRLVGEDFDTHLAAVDRRGKPQDGQVLEVEVELASAVVEQNLEHRNVLGWVNGSDAELRDQVVVVGAHYDHVGVDPRGRIGTGADDNASGVAALMEIAQALGRSPPRRSVLVVAFAAEEDGLVGSQNLVSDLGLGRPFGLERVVAMINLDMVGRGDPRTLEALGGSDSPDLLSLVSRARRLGPTGLSKVITDGGEELWQRSDHYPFARSGIPALFLFEEQPISKNLDYHTWRDGLAGVDALKITRAARLGFNLVWLIAEDDDPPRRQR
jgi:hypothetical protein